MRGAWLAVLLAAALLPSAAAATTVTVQAATMPDEVPMGVVHDGLVFWVFATMEASTRVSMYDPVSDTLSTTGILLPMAARDAVWGGDRAYVLGDADGGALFYSFKPPGVVQSLPAPSGNVGAANMFWDGTHVFLAHSLASPPTLRFDPGTLAWESMPYGMGPGSPARFGGASVFGDGRGYSLGMGSDGPGLVTGEVVETDPVAGTAVVRTQAMPVYARNVAAAWIGSSVHVFYENSIYVFDPDTGSITLDPTPLPLQVYEARAAARGPCEAYVFAAGASPTSITGNRILRVVTDYGPCPATPPPAPPAPSPPSPGWPPSPTPTPPPSPPPSSPPPASDPPPVPPSALPYAMGPDEKGPSRPYARDPSGPAALAAQATPLGPGLALALLAAAAVVGWTMRGRFT